MTLGLAKHVKVAQIGRNSNVFRIVGHKVRSNPYVYFIFIRDKLLLHHWHKS